MEGCNAARAYLLYKDPEVDLRQNYIDILEALKKQLMRGRVLRYILGKDDTVKCIRSLQLFERASRDAFDWEVNDLCVELLEMLEQPRDLRPLPPQCKELVQAIDKSREAANKRDEKRIEERRREERRKEYVGDLQFWDWQEEDLYLSAGPPSLWKGWLGGSLLPRRRHAPPQEGVSVLAAPSPLTQRLDSSNIGCCGVISVTGNVAPRQMVSMIQAAREGKVGGWGVRGSD
uniref:Uncharacterized protein n=1 Tax=Chromera velia CCMP2878 TaxID=1169474 RepID=A0A0G4I628_9ALVE|eukprot:Cvel_36219.t1-p1 / transcript=Cvel_36219.t1 / gene=Cvel_36219 / organism=Chromera_velia_CCMP2878 / gene_product=hypothetical protein / transcript_product=hypothetical protein / location=Cvel_scaffold7044:11-2152(+) / protein_length=231 / sequence_SO=supercontig / SO=protein_coding / is_pseudo=false